jgi:hypothetical protein
MVTIGRDSKDPRFVRWTVRHTVMRGAASQQRVLASGRFELDQDAHTAADAAVRALRAAIAGLEDQNVTER